MAKFLPIALNWALTVVLLPTLYYFWDYLKSQDVKKKADNSARELNNAKLPNDINNAIDKLP